MKKKFLKIIFLSFFAISNAVAEKVNVFDFTEEELKTLH